MRNDRLPASLPKRFWTRSTIISVSAISGTSSSALSPALKPLWHGAEKPLFCRCHIGHLDTDKALAYADAALVQWPLFAPHLESNQNHWPQFSSAAFRFLFKRFHRLTFLKRLSPLTKIHGATLSSSFLTAFIRRTKLLTLRRHNKGTWWTRTHFSILCAVWLEA